MSEKINDTAQNIIEPLCLPLASNLDQLVMDKGAIDSLRRLLASDEIDSTRAREISDALQLNLKVKDLPETETPGDSYDKYFQVHRLESDGTSILPAIAQCVSQVLQECEAGANLQGDEKAILLDSFNVILDMIDEI